MLHKSLHFLTIFLLLLVETNVKYLFPLICLEYPFTLPMIRYKGIFTLLIFTYFESLICHISNVINKNIFVWLFIYVNFIWIKFFYIDSIIEKVVSAVCYNGTFEFNTHFNLYYLYNSLVVTWYAKFISVYLSFSLARLFIK